MFTVIQLEIWKRSDMISPLATVLISAESEQIFPEFPFSFSDINLLIFKISPEKNTLNNFDGYYYLKAVFSIILFSWSQKE